MQEKNPELTSKEEEVLRRELLLNELRLYLGEEKPPIDGKEFTITDNQIPINPLDSSVSDDESELQKEPQDTITDDKLDLAFNDINEVITKPYAEMPAFYPNQLEFEAIEGLPGVQKNQVEHKAKTVLKNKYWGKILKSSYEMSMTKIPRPEHLIRMLELYVINQEKLKKKRKEQAAVAIKKQLTTPRISTKSITSSRKLTLMDLHTRRKRQKGESLHKRSSFAQSLSGVKDTPRQLLSLSIIHAASSEIQRRLDKLEKDNVKINTEYLARDTKNVLIRKPIYRRSDTENISFADFDNSYTKMLTNYLFAQDLVKKWKQSL